MAGWFRSAGRAGLVGRVLGRLARWAGVAGRGGLVGQAAGRLDRGLSGRLGLAGLGMAKLGGRSPWAPRAGVGLGRGGGA